MFEQGHGKLFFKLTLNPKHTTLKKGFIKFFGFFYDLAGIFRGYKCSRFSRIEPVPRKFYTLKKFIIVACSVLWIRG